MKAVLRTPHGDVWTDKVPDGAKAVSWTETTVLEDQGQVVQDGKWGEVRVFQQVGFASAIKLIKP